MASGAFSASAAESFRRYMRLLNASKCIVLSALALLTFASALPAQGVCDPNLKGNSIGGICLPSVKSKCVNDCALRCGNDGECIFGCEVGQDFGVDRCYTDCSGFNPRCLDSCLQTIDCIGRDCLTVTPEVSINRGTVVFNRATQAWQQTVVVKNLSCHKLGSVNYRLTSLAPGWTLTNGDGVGPDGTPYKNLSDLPSLASVTVTLQLARTFTPTLNYTPVVYGLDIAVTP